jgi:hypothetical protein
MYSYILMQPVSEISLELVGASSGVLKTCNEDPKDEHQTRQRESARPRARHLYGTATLADYHLVQRVLLAVVVVLEKSPKGVNIQCAMLILFFFSFLALRHTTIS